MAKLAGKDLQDTQRRIVETAIREIRNGRLDTAAATLESENRIALKTPVGCNILGDIHLRHERPREALKAFDRALRIAPRFPEAHANRGVALQDLGRLEDALKAQDRAIRLRPGFATALFNRGNVLRDLFRFEEAIDSYDNALKARTDFEQALVNRGSTFVDIGRGREAIDDFRRVIRRDSDNEDALVGLARAYRQIGEPGDAAVALERALRIDPQSLKARVEQCDLLRETRRHASALELAEKIVEDHPDVAEAALAKATCLAELQRYDEALAVIERAVDLAPRSPSGHATRALILGQTGRFDEQAQALRRAESLGGRGEMIDHVRAMVLSEKKEFAAAAELYERALSVNPQAAASHSNLGMLYLKLGRLREGWREYEWRHDKNAAAHRHFVDAVAEWKGEPIAGKRLLVHTEQGHGDNIQFFRFVRQIAMMGADVTFVAPKPLVSTLRPHGAGATVVETLGPSRDFDYQASIMSLPFLLDITLENLPTDTPYIEADPAFVEKWRERLGAGHRVGLVWQGNPSYGADLHRSIALRNYRPLADVDGVRLISLQVFHGLDQLDDLPDGMVVERLGEEITNNPGGYREVCGAMANLDLIVTSDTGPAHLAGAMGLPVWVALRDNPDWRWLVEGNTSPWYPTMRVFRQQNRGDWGPVFEEIAAALRERLSAGSAASR